MFPVSIRDGVRHTGQMVRRILPGRRDGWLLIVVGAGVILSIAIVVALWGWLSGGDSASTTLRNIALVALGAVGLPLALWRSFVAERQATTAQKGLLNERYQRGADMLGSEVLSVRLAGIYALEELAKEYPEEYHTQVMRLFCAFARLPTRDQSLESRRATIRPGSLLGIRQDVAAIMEAIGSRDEARITVERRAGLRLDLRGADLRELDVIDADLSRAMLQHVNLSGAFLTNVDLTEASLVGADLSASQWRGVILAGAHIWSANFSDAMLQDAQMVRMSLHAVNFTGANLGRANLAQGIFQDAIVAKAWLEGANLADTTFLRTDLSQSRMAKADLSGAELIDTNLAGVSLFEANVSGTQFSHRGGQQVRGLTQRQLDQAQAQPEAPPSLDGVLDAESGEPVQWRGKPLGGRGRDC